MLNIKSLNLIYWIIKAELLFYKKFVGDLTYVVFKLNPYDSCVENKIINGNKMTVMWHIDDIKVSQESKKIVTRMTKYLKKTCENIFEGVSGKMKISRVKFHEYLVMTLDFHNHYNSILLWSHILNIWW